MEIGGHRLGEGRTFLIAELSANHLQDFDLARRTLDAMAASGADAVKLQTYTADTITLDSDEPPFRIRGGTLWDGQTLHALYQSAYTPWEWHAPLRDHAHALGMVFFSSPFDPTAVDLLEALDVPVHKIASFEITDIPLIRYVASKGRPIIMSTGIADAPMIQEAVDAIRAEGNDQIVLLKCTSSYPAPPAEANLRAIPELAKRFGVLAGLSDHTLGTAAPVAAVALGATVIEKHFILDKSLGGPDAAFSLEPAEFKAMTDAVRLVEQALGVPSLEPTAKSLAGRAFCRSLFVAEDIEEGALFTAANVRSVRPGDGLHPRHLPDVLGKRANRALRKGTPFALAFVAPE
ncbi:MAG: pseudaminic acid synthase [Alphaproteobacteria bacterium]|nr:pseudaminic acid synthase [Alphaproteobacteria bacterium]